MIALAQRWDKGGNKRDPGAVPSAGRRLGSRDHIPETTMDNAANTAPYMGIISWIILGLIAGFIGSKIINRTGEGIFLDVILGVVGAIVGGFLFSLVGA
jgi:hypothetical protein